MNWRLNDWEAETKEGPVNLLASIVGYLTIGAAAMLGIAGAVWVFVELHYWSDVSQLRDKWHRWKSASVNQNSGDTA